MVRDGNSRLNEEDEFLVMMKGKGRTEEEVKKIRREQEGDKRVLIRTRRRMKGGESTGIILGMVPNENLLTPTT